MDHEGQSQRFNQRVIYLLDFPPVWEGTLEPLYEKKWIQIYKSSIEFIVVLKI